MKEMKKSKWDTVPTHMINRPHYKSGVIITDGRNFIRLGWTREPDWTPNDVHKHKDYEYCSCTCVIDNRTKCSSSHAYLFRRIEKEKYYSVYNGWIQALSGWIQIKESSISIKILNQLKK